MYPRGTRHPDGLLLEDAADRAQPVRVGVVQRHIGDAVVVLVGQQRTVDERNPETAPAHDRQPHRDDFATTGRQGADCRP